MENTRLTNSEVLELIGLDESVLEGLQSKESQTYIPTANQFLSALVNKIVYQTVDGFGWKNPFRKFDGFVIDFGDTIENVIVETPKGYTFNPNATDPFTKLAPNVQALYATINYERQYQATIQDTLLRRSALNQYGFMNIIDNILKQLTTAKNIEEYYATIAMLNNPEIFANSTGAEGSKTFETLDLSTYTTLNEKSSALTKKIIDVTSSFELPSDTHNALGILTATNKEDILLVIKRDLLNMINLDYLAGVYNLDKVELITRIMVVESFQVMDDTTQQLNGADIGFMVLDVKGFDNHVALEDSGMIYNPKGKYTNHFMNLWKIIAYKYFYNAEAYIVKLES